MAKVTLKGREIPLLYTTWEMKLIGEQIAPIQKAIRLMMGQNPEDEKDTSLYGSAQQIETIGKMICILGNAGLEEAGQEADLTEKKVLRWLAPRDLGEIVNSVIDALNEGMLSEIPEKAKDGPVDVTLEEMNKKKEKAD